MAGCVDPLVPISPSSHLFICIAAIFYWIRGFYLFFNCFFPHSCPLASLLSLWPSWFSEGSTCSYQHSGAFCSSAPLRRTWNHRLGWMGRDLKVPSLSMDSFHQSRLLQALSSLVLKRSIFLKTAAILDGELSDPSWDPAHTHFWFPELQWNPVNPRVYNMQVKFLHLIMDTSFIFTAERTIPSHTTLRSAGIGPCGHCGTADGPGDGAVNSIPLVCCALAPCPAFPHAHPTSQHSPADSQQLQSHRGSFLDDLRDLFFTAAGFGSFFHYSSCL